MKIVTLLFAAALVVPAAAYAQTDYPPCSASVTDHCMQHEGGGHGWHHHMMHHRHHHHK